MNNASDLTSKEILLKEIDLIQNCIKRMASNSFLLKGWFITLLSVIMGMTTNFHSHALGSIVAIFICLFFWWMDAFYLRLEKFYVRKYNWVIQNRISTNDFSFNLNPLETEMWLLTENENISTFKVMISKTLMIFYGIALLFSLLVLWGPKLWERFFS